MKVNWILRLKNKATLISLIGVVLGFVYGLLGVFNIVPPVGQDQAQNFLFLLVDVLVGLGVVVDPTTAGVSDSQRALNYTEPNKDTATLG